MIRLAWPEIGDEDIEAVAAVLRSGRLVQGESVRQFEEALASFVGTTHAVAVSSCTAALHLTLKALNIGPGDEVAVPCYSWPATANVVVLCGAEPVFIDIDSRMFNVDPVSLEQATEGRTRLKAIIPVHAFGGMASMGPILDIARRHGLPVIEDAACALGASLNDRHAGAWGLAGCFSFHPRKVITTGEGGIVVTDDPDLARRIRVLRNHGLDVDAGTPDFVEAGFNYRMTEFQAALGLTQFAKLERILESRRNLARRYDELLAGTGLTLPCAPTPEVHSYQSYVVLLPPDTANGRDKILDGLRTHGIEATVGTHCIPLTTFFRRRGGYRPTDFPRGNDVSIRALTLPLHLQLTDEDQRQIAEVLARLMDGMRER